MLPDFRLTLLGMGLVGAGVGGLVVYAIWRRQLATIVDQAHQAAKADILAGATQAAAAADHALAAARDPAAIDKALANSEI